jgi:predicted nuclease of restriction endonuclease-like (RecB) superfamily
MNEILDKEYFNDLNKIKETIKQNQNKAMVYVNSQMILTYYQIGTIINQRKKWGSKYIQNLANDLKEYGKGYSIQNLYRMSRIANEFSEDELFSQPAREIPWFTLLEIVQKSKSHEEMLFYINETHKKGWSRSMVLNQISMKLYERSLIEPDTTKIIKSDDLSNELFKDTYVFDFLDKNNIKNEKDLKNQMVDNIIRFLNELGPGFSLVGKEYKLITPTNEEFFIDLLMYHTKIHCYVVIEVKVVKFKPEHLGQLMFYVNALDALEKTERDEPTIGLLLCKDADKFVVETTLKNSLMKLGVSKYKLIEELPEYLERRLKEKNED